MWKYFLICDNNHLCSDYITNFNIKNFYKKNNYLPSNLNFLFYLNNIICIEDSNLLIEKYNKYDNDNFNLSLIFTHLLVNKNTIRIVHKRNENLKNKILCIFGVLEN